MVTIYKAVYQFHQKLTETIAEKSRKKIYYANTYNWLIVLIKVKAIDKIFLAYGENPFGKGTPVQWRKT